VLSLGASITAAARNGAAVRVVTVFAGDSTSTSAAGRWDALSGFVSEGEAARARAGEDDNACRIVGAEPVRLPFPDRQYPVERDAAEIRRAVVEALTGSEVVLIPGYPLRHEDHLWLARLLLDGEPLGARLALYAEQPYAAQTKAAPTAMLTSEARWITLSAAPTDQVVKLRACRAYRSQIEPLGGLRAMLGVLAYEAGRGGESIAWLDS